MNQSASEPRRLSQSAKTLVDMGPLGIFFVIYFFGPRLAPVLSRLIGSDLAIEEGEQLFAAVAGFIPAFAVAFVYSVWRERRVAPMLLVSFVVVGVLGSLTLVLRDKTFFYMKPTIAYLLFAATLAGGLIGKRNFLKTLFDGALHLPEAIWATLTRRYAAFFLVLAIANEVAWRWLMRDCDINGEGLCPGEPTWVQLKLFGFTAVNVVFALAQTPLIARHMETAGAAAEDPDPAPPAAKGENR